MHLLLSEAGEGVKFSIIIVACKDYASLEKCLELIKHIPDKEVIVWDNTPSEEVKRREWDDWRGPKWLGDGTGIGFAAGCNRAVKEAQGDTLIFINPDTEPTGDWLDRMCMGFEEGYDAIGTTSDYIAGIQHYSRYLDYPKPFIDTKLIIPVCMAIKAETFRELGGFDESFFLGCEDLDFSWRMQLAGKRMGIATDVFVHHVGHTGFSLTPDKDKIIEAGEARIREKLLEFYGPDVPSSEEIWGCKILPTQIKRPRLSLCIITSIEDADNAFTARHDVWDVVDEIVLVVTGKGYLEKPQEKLKVFGYEWHDDFAAARNFALSKCTGDWVLWLDADDRVTPENAALIDALIHKPGNNVALQVCHFAFKVENVDQDGVHDAFHQSRLFPRLPGLVWGGVGGCKGLVHESYHENAQKLGLHLVTTNITIQHHGYSDPEAVRAKQDRNLRLLLKEPDNAFKFYNIGTSYMALNEDGKAEEAFRKALERSGTEDKHFIDNCRYLLSLSLYRQGKIEEMKPHLFPNSKPDAVFIRGMFHHETGDNEKACDAFFAYLKMGEITDNLGTNYPHFRRQAVKMLTEIGVLKV